MLLYWTITKTLPQQWVDNTLKQEEGVAQLTLVRCWTLGDKYDIGAFQDLTMIEMLHLLELSDGAFVTLEAAHEAFENTPSESELRILVARRRRTL